MSDSPGASSPALFHAQPLDQRKTSQAKILRPNQIPDAILKDEFLNGLIGSSLPKNYNFEIHKTIWKINQVCAKRVLLQFPEGLLRFGTVIVDIIDGYYKQNGQDSIKFMIMGDLTYGACCIDDFLAASMGCDLVVHYAHSCLVPINQMSSSLKYLYVFLDIKFDLENIINCIKHNFDVKTHKIALASTIQFVASVHEVSRQLNQLGYKTTLPHSRPLSSGEVLGCTAPKLDQSVNTIVFICDGRFHLEALMIANPDVEAYRYDPYSRKMTREMYEFKQMYDQRMSAINKAVDVMRRNGTFGFILGTLGRQGNELVYDRMIKQLQKHTECTSIRVLMPEVVHDALKEFDSIDVWVQVACPRLSIDWGTYFGTPLLNPYEFAQCIRILKNQKPGINDISEKNYAMDFYSKHSAYNVTPNHICTSNPNCCNVENSSYGLSICAERTAAVKAVSEGYLKFKACFVLTNSNEVVAPCGACRQFLNEFGSDMIIYLVKKDRSCVTASLKEILPLSFGRNELESGVIKS